MAEVTKQQHLPINGGTLISDLKSLFSLFKTRRTAAFAYGFMFAFVAFTVFLAFSPSPNYTSPWFASIFSTSTSGSSSSFSSVFFPNGTSSSPRQQNQSFFSPPSQTEPSRSANTTAAAQSATVNKQPPVLTNQTQPTILNPNQTSIVQPKPLVTPKNSTTSPEPTTLLKNQTDSTHNSDKATVFTANQTGITAPKTPVAAGNGSSVLVPKSGLEDKSVAEKGVEKNLTASLLNKQSNETKSGVSVEQRKPGGDDLVKSLMNCEMLHGEYAPLTACLAPLPRYSWPLPWPNRLTSKPPSLIRDPEGEEMFYKDTIHWTALVSDAYQKNAAINWLTVRNVMDMNAGFGGFAAALTDQQLWVMNVVPIHLPNTLPAIFDRGLIGIYHDWCESLNTYPRTYDLLHSSFLFEKLPDRCDIVDVVVEMDRILRPGGYLLVQDTIEVIDKLRPILQSLHWSTALYRDQFLFGKKGFWRPSRAASKS